MDYYEQERLLMNEINGHQPLNIEGNKPYRKLFYAGSPIKMTEIGFPLTLRPCVVVDFNSELSFGMGPWMAMMYQSGCSIYYYEDASDVEGIGELIADGQQEEVFALRRKPGS